MHTNFLLCICMTKIQRKCSLNVTKNMNRVDLKVVMLGHEAVGKTSLLERYVNERFNENMDYQSTIATAYAAKQIDVDGRKLVLGLWDTAGSERFRTMVRVYYRGAKAAIVCYDICDQQSFNRAKSWVRELRSQEEECKIYLCATKWDTAGKLGEPTPDLETVRDYARGIQSKFYVTSSKTGEGVADLFREIAKDYVPDPKIPRKSDDLVNLTIQEKKKGCCAFLHRR